MTNQEKKIIKIACRWWRNHRPVNWDKKTHLNYPGINSCTETERQLAIAVGKYEKTKKTKRTSQ